MVIKSRNTVSATREIEYVVEFTNNCTLLTPVPLFEPNDDENPQPGFSCNRDLVSLAVY